MQQKLPLEIAGTLIEFPIADVMKAIGSDKAKLYKLLLSEGIIDPASYLKDKLRSIKSAEQFSQLCLSITSWWSKAIEMDKAESSKVQEACAEYSALSIEELLARIPYAGSTYPVELMLSILAMNSESEPIPLWIWLVGVPGCGKSELIDLFDIPGSERITTYTANAFSPGSPNIEDMDKTFALLDLIKGKTMIVDDLSPILGNDQRVREKVLSEMVAMYGQHFNKASAGGIKKHMGTFNFIAGLTPSAYRENLKIIAKFGQRILIHRMEVVDDISNNGIPKAEWKRQCVAFLSKCRKSTPTISDELKAMLYSIAKQVAEIRSWDTDTESPHRLFKQMLNVCYGRAKVFGRNVDFTDIKFAYPLAWNTIPQFEVFDYISKYPSNRQVILAKTWISESKLTDLIAHAKKKGVIHESDGVISLNEKFSDILCAATEDDVSEVLEAIKEADI